MTSQKILRQYFGYDYFRGGQEQLIDAIMQGNDVLGVMPTGAGKSICFQVPALLMSGITLVISPLVSLMKDQVGALVQLGIAAAFINSSLTPKQMEMALYNASKGKYKLIYVAPERLLSEEFLEFALNADISMLTVDEAHCVSQWGQDFRPSYLQITQFIDKLSYRPVISTFTATATPEVKDDIVNALKLHNPTVLVTGFNRENLHFSVDNPKNKKAALMEFLQKNVDKAGIIYCTSRKNVEEVCEHLNVQGVNATRYHAGLSDTERHNNQDDFLYDRKRVMVATNAFGMGIDKSNVSFVVHYNMPKDMESYYQEAGRAGRDGTFAECLLLYAPIDVRTNQWMIENTKNSNDISEKSTQLKQRDYERLKLMTFYSTTNNCLREFILHYFGDNTTSYCGNCSNCNTKFETMDITKEAQKILLCIQQLHERYGSTMVINVLRKSKNERITQLRLDELPVYGTSDKSADTLHAIIGYLLEEKYIIQTDEQYSVLKLTPLAQSVVQGEVQLSMKLAKEKEQAKAKSAKKHKDVPESVAKLYDQLRDLRSRIAGEQGVPAYYVFADRALVDMCVLLPRTLAEFAKVSGVGDAKLQRYGDEFIAIITAYCNDESIEKAENVTDELKGLIEITKEPTQISTIAKRINEVLKDKCGVSVSPVKIGNYLLAKGFLTVDEHAETANKIPTEKGETLGITRELRSHQGKEYYINLYSQDFQEFIISQIENML